VYLAGLAGFTLALLACSLAPGTGALIGARIAQGACAAVMVPQVLTGIQVSFDARARARARALSVLVMTMSGSAVIGQALGGPLIAADAFGTGWRSIFWVNVPVGVVALAGAAILLPRESRGKARLDLPGVGLLTAAMALLVTPLAFGREQGWPAWTWACLGASVVAFAGFTAFERRLTARGGDPVINLRLLARPVVALGAGGFGLGMAYSSLLGRLTAAVPPEEAADLSGLVNTSAQVAAVAGVAACGTVYFALAARPAYAFAVVTATLAASGFAGAACSFLSARRRAAEVPAARAGERVPARSGSPG
jgi:MFS family permease